MAKTTNVAEELKNAFANFVDTVMANAGAVAADEDAEEEEGEWEPLDRDETTALSIKELRALAAERGLESTKKADILAELEEGGHFGDTEEDEEDEEDEDEDAEEADDEDEDDEEDEDEDEDEEGEYTREDLEELDLKQLRAIAKEQGATAADVRGKDQDALIELILGEEDEDEEDEDDEDEDSDEETEELDEDALKAMSLAELRSLAKELEITVRVPKAHKDGKTKEKKFFIETILNSGEEE